MTMPRNKYMRCNRAIVKRALKLTIFVTVLRVVHLIRSMNEKKNDLQIFQFKSQPYPSHLDPVNPTTDVESTGFVNIDFAHCAGMVHNGNWIALVDSHLSPSNGMQRREHQQQHQQHQQRQPRILLLKRGKDMVTCPKSWGLVGEHAYRDEPPIETTRRAIREELGSTFSDLLDSDNASINTLTEHPVYYERHYGPKNGNRVDRQLTWLWLVEVDLEAEERNGADVSLHLDEEVADHKWVPLDELERWLEADVLLKDFCHDTIFSLLQLVLKRMKELATNNEHAVVHTK